jgi:hypothetical protein
MPISVNNILLPLLLVLAGTLFLQAGRPADALAQSGQPPCDGLNVGDYWEESPGVNYRCDGQNWKRISGSEAPCWHNLHHAGNIWYREDGSVEVCDENQYGMMQWRETGFTWRPPHSPTVQAEARAGITAARAQAVARAAASAGEGRPSFPDESDDCCPLHKSFDPSPCRTT